MIVEFIDSALLKKSFIVATNTLEKNKEVVNSLNVFPVPDGDTGTNMSLTMQSAARQIKNLKTEIIEEIASAAAKGSLMGARGNSGVILSQLFRGFSKGLKGKEKLDVKTLAYAFKLASDTAYKAVMKPVEGTILTVARECAEKALEISNKETDIVVFLEKVINHGDITLQKTPEMLAVLKQAGVVDAGGKGLLFILKGALNAITGKDELFIEEIDDTEIDLILHEQSDSQKDIKYGYCTEFIINATDANSTKFREHISRYGDSLLVVGSENIIKTHIHTNHPGEVIEEALKLGELIDLKIDNMRYQHKNRVVEETEKETESQMKKYSFIAVAMGKGIENVFNDLNVDYVITGGQTMNPSTEDILNAVDKVNSENIIILPNNSNIILAATQAKKLSKKNIEVLPTKSIPQGVAALLAFKEELNLERNIENMIEVIKEVKTGQITYAVRDTVIDDKEIKKDDILGICDGDIMAVGNDIKEVSLKLLEDMMSDENDVITIFYGEDISEEEADGLAEIVEEQFEDFEVEVIYGGQPLYYYLFSVE